MKTLIGFILFSISFSAFCAEKVCVLSLFERGSKEEKKVSRIFDNYVAADVFYEPKYSDIKHCFTGEYDEVVWVSHGTLSGIINQFAAPVYIDQESGTKSMIYKRFFTEIARNLNSQIKLRIAFCGAGIPNLQTSMDPLIEAVKNLDGDVDFSPQMTLMSKLHKKPVTDLTLSWLSESIESHRLIRWKTNTKRNQVCDSDRKQGCNRARARYLIPVESI